MTPPFFPSPNSAPRSSPSVLALGANPSSHHVRMTHAEELRLATRLRELRRDLLALALLDPTSRAEVERVAADLAARRVRIEAVIDGAESAPDATRRFDEFRSAVAHLGDEQLGGEPLGDEQLGGEHIPGASPASRAGGLEPLDEGLERALCASRGLTGSMALQWDCVERLLQCSWVGSSGCRAARQPSRSLPPALAERARRARAEIDTILESFVASHQGLVANVVRHYRGLGLSQEDLMQDGNIGLLRALEKFDERRGNTFASYAVWWVRESVRRALAHQARTIRLPAHAIAKRRAIGNATRRLAHELGRDPSSQELSNATGMAPESIDDVMRMSKEPLSLDAPRAGDTEITLGDVIADRSRGNPNEYASTRESLDHLQVLLAGLSPREQRVLSLRFGLDGSEEQTLEEIGRSLDLTRERVRQIEAGALHKLERATRARRLDL
jgi:RNA polymerase sigma factor (sigma-70 family)